MAKAAPNKGLPRTLAAKNKTFAAIAAIATPDATDTATAVTLANATKAKVNAIIAALKS